MTEQMKKKLTGWFETSFWVDAHYALAALGTVIIFGQALFGKFNIEFAGFVASMWVTAVGNDRINMPAVKE
jgi:hypothetical protein